MVPSYKPEPRRDAKLGPNSRVKQVGELRDEKKEAQEPENQRYYRSGSQDSSFKERSKDNPFNTGVTETLKETEHRELQQAINKSMAIMQELKALVAVKGLREKLVKG